MNLLVVVDSRMAQVDWRFAYMVADDAIELRHTNRLDKHCQIRANLGHMLGRCRPFLSLQLTQNPI